MLNHSFSCSQRDVRPWGHTLFMSTTDDPIWARVDAELTRRRQRHQQPASWSALGTLIEASDQRMHNWRLRGIPARQHLAVAMALGWSVDQLHGLAEASAPTQLQEAIGRYTTQTGEAPRSVESVDLRSAVPIIDPITIEWESILVQALPRHFQLVLRDDAMAPEFPRGCVVTFSTVEGAPRPRDAVLVEDRDGGVHFREYEAGRGDQWRAVALNSGFQALESERDGLRVLAICMGRWGRRD